MKQDITRKKRQARRSAGSTVGTTGIVLEVFYGIDFAFVWGYSKKLVCFWFRLPWHPAINSCGNRNRLIV
jgi:hypothetical protein